MKVSSMAVLGLTQQEAEVLHIMLNNYHRKHWTGGHIYHDKQWKAGHGTIGNKAALDILHALAKKLPFIKQRSSEGNCNFEGWYWIDREMLYAGWLADYQQRQIDHANYCRYTCSCNPPKLPTHKPPETSYIELLNFAGIG